MNTEPRRITLFERITFAVMIMLFTFDTANLFGDHHILYILYCVVLNFAVWGFVE